MTAIARRAAALLPLAAACLLLLSPGLRAQESGAAHDPSSAASALPVPKQHSVVTHHVATIGGKRIAYDAIAGTLLLYDAKDEPTASVFYHAYVAQGLGPTSRRPLTFSYNGGPGSASAYVDIGGFGPRTIRIPSPEQMPPPPYEMIDNADSVLDRTDLVFIDAVGTGYSRVAGHGSGKDFYGVDQDGKAFAQFIRRYITLNDRWNSPKYLIGESYGTTRSAVLANMLENAGIAVSGITLVSTVLDFETVFGETGNDEQYVNFLPTEAAVAAYHHKLANEPQNLDAYLAEVRAFAAGPYSQALIAGDALPDADRRRIAEKVAAYIGLPVDYVLRSNLRVPPSRFQKVLLGNEEETVGRYDGRFKGFDIDPIGADADNDPSSDAISSAFTSAFNAYLRDELKYQSSEEYVPLSVEVNQAWDWGRGGTTSPVATSVLDDLAQAMTADRYLRVLSVNGIYDMATPFFATEQSLHHLGIAPALQKNISFQYYPSGHMIYVNPVAHAKLHDDLEAFYAVGNG